MSTYTDIRVALENQLATATGVDAGTDGNVAWENVKFDPGNSTSWLRCRLVVASQQQNTLGPNGARKDMGLFLVDVFTGQNVGAGAADILVDAVLAVFAPGTTITANDKKVRILAAERNQGINDEPWYFVPVSINWYTYINE